MLKNLKEISRPIQKKGCRAYEKDSFDFTLPAAFIPFSLQSHLWKKILNTDDFTYTVIRFDKTYTWIFKNAEPSDLTVEEIKETERLLLTCIEEYNREPYPLKAHPEYKLDKNKFIIDLTQYKKQFIPVLNRKGEKEVWVNCFCEDNFNDWKQQIVKVQDGGKWFLM